VTAAAGATEPGIRPAPVLVLGVGNILLSDEGIGVRVVETLKARYVLPAEVEVLDGGTAGMDLLDILAGRRHLIIVDAIADAGPPGSVHRLADEDVPRFLRQRLSPHQLGLPDLLAFLALTGEAPATVTIFAIVPRDLSLGLALSAELERLRTPVAALVAAELARLGVAPTPAI
jgi:hydrogenase maturation protease